MKKEIKNLAASVLQRLANCAREKHRPFDELLQYFAIERFLYRLSRSKAKEKLVLKGALMFVVWDTARSRATRDIDLLGRMDNTMGDLLSMVKEICEVSVEPDGISYNPASVTGERIIEDADYEGVRIRFTAQLGQARIPMQIDFGFGDTVFPHPIEVHYPTLLGMPVPVLKGYPPETVVAEKFQAMVELGMVNSRLKDFYDVWLMAQQFNFDGKVLREAVMKTFANRKTQLNTEPTALSDEFAKSPDKEMQWSAFVRRGRLTHAPKDLTTAIEVLRDFLLPIVKAIIEGGPIPARWVAPGPWS